MPRPNRGRELWRDPRTGLWHIRWFEDGRRRMRSTGSRDRGEAETVLAHALDELARRRLPAEPTVADVLTAYAEASSERHSARHIASRCKIVSAALGHLRVPELRQAHIRDYIGTRRTVGIKDGTIREELSKLRAALRWAAAEGMCREQPIMIPLRSSVRRRWLTRDECDSLLAATVEPHVRLFVLLALHTAGRASAILELPWSAIDFQRRIVDLGRKEGGKERAVVPMTRTLAAALAEAKERATTPWVVEYAGERVRNGRTGWRKTRARSGLTDVWRHDLRRTAGSLMLQEGVAIELVSAFLGHKSIATTRRVYAHLTVEHLREAANRLDRSSDTSLLSLPLARQNQGRV